MAQSIIRNRLTAKGSYPTIYIRISKVSEIYNSKKMSHLSEMVGHYQNTYFPYYDKFHYFLIGCISLEMKHQKPLNFSDFF